MYNWPAKALEPYTSLLTLAGAGAATCGGVEAARVLVSFGPEHNRRPNARDVQIDEVWSRRLEAVCRHWNSYILVELYTSDFWFMLSIFGCGFFLTC